MENNENLIVVRQLPIIEDQLREIKANVESRVGVVLAMDCTEETRQSVKAARAELSKEFAALETRRKEVKAAVLAPYEAFEQLYKECAADIYRAADAQLKTRIDDVESGLKKQKADRVEAYFNEYRQSLGISADYVSFASAGIRITLTTSEKSLKDAARSFLDRIAGDLGVIDTQEHSEEILVEYLHDLNLSRSITTVSNRQRAIAAAQERKKAAAEQTTMLEESAKQVEAATAPEPVVMPPTMVDVPDTVQSDPTVYSTSFKVTASLDKLRALKQFLIEGGYEYEQL